MSKSHKPYTTLGEHLRTVREQSKRSLAEVSGAVEIDEHTLQQIESGQQRPEEDVMLLLISYFNVQDQEALHLWELAQYDSDLADHLQFDQVEAVTDAADQFSGKPMIMLLAVDVRTMYSDGAEVTWNKSGLTLNFTQTNNQANNQSQNISVSRVGMSYEQAEQVLQSLQKALLHAKYTGATKLLPPPNRDPKD